MTTKWISRQSIIEVQLLDNCSSTVIELEQQQQGNHQNNLTSATDSQLSVYHDTVKDNSQ